MPATPEAASARGAAAPLRAAALDWLSHRRRPFGGLTLFFLATAIMSGLLLMVYYRPSVAAAHDSVAIVSAEVRLGWLVRGIHAWSADLLVLCALFHLADAYFTRAYYRAGRAGWVTGVVLLVLVLAFGFTGNLLPWDQYAYWSTEAARETIAGVPVLGGALLAIFWGGWEIGEEVLFRFYAFHVGILPVVVLALVALHLTIWRARVGGPGPAPAPTAGAGLDLLIICLLLVGVLLTLAVAVPPPLAPPADPLHVLAGVQLRWYFRPASQLLGSLPGGVAILVLSVLVAVILAIPFVDRSGERTRWGTTAHWAIGIGALLAWIILGVRS